MFGFLRTKVKDIDLSREYVQRTFAIGRTTCPSIAEAVQMKANFPVNDDTSLEISVAILGASLAMLKGYSQIMTAERGSRIEEFCKSSLEKDYGLTTDFLRGMNKALNEYQDVFRESVLSEKNPFGEISGIMLCRCLGPRSRELCLPGSDNLNPFILQIVGDVMTMIVMRTIEFWKKK